MWESRGYQCPDSVSELQNSLAGRTVLVCGNGQGVFEDAEIACLNEWPVFVGVNDVGTLMPQMSMWVTLHGENFPNWIGMRRANGLDCKFTTHTAYCKMGDYDWSGLEPVHFPLSGLLAMQIAWVLGAERIILAGCPGDDRPRFNGTRNDYPGFAYGAGTTDSDRAVNTLLEREMARLPLFKAAVRSCSGATRKFFGGISDD